MNIVDLKFVPQGTPDLNIQAFDCGRKSVNDFFHNEAQDYQDELFGKTYYFCLPDSPSDIVAGFTVANASIFTKRLPNARQKKIGRELHHEKGLIKGNRLREARKRQTKSETIRGKAADRLPWWGVSAAFFGVTVPKTDGMSCYALLNFSLGCLQRGQRQSSGRSS